MRITKHKAYSVQIDLEMHHEIGLMLDLLLWASKAIERECPENRENLHLVFNTMAEILDFANKLNEELR